ncbi:MAG: hypothetical protein KGL39_40205 [Patescibacteria group bacterium]|nr:hypothetical protein [Patescibacteria group bacterium]
MKTETEISIPPQESDAAAFRLARVMAECSTSPAAELSFLKGNKMEVSFDMEYLCKLAVKEAENLPAFEGLEIIAKVEYFDEDHIKGVLVSTTGKELT